MRQKLTTNENKENDKRKNFSKIVERLMFQSPRASASSQHTILVAQQGKHNNGISYFKINLQEKGERKTNNNMRKNCGNFSIHILRVIKIK